MPNGKQMREMPPNSANPGPEGPRRRGTGPTTRGPPRGMRGHRPGGRGRRHGHRGEGVNVSIFRFNGVNMTHRTASTGTTTRTRVAVPLASRLTRATPAARGPTRGPARRPARGMGGHRPTMAHRMTHCVTHHRPFANAVGGGTTTACDLLPRGSCHFALAGPGRQARCRRCSCALLRLACCSLSADHQRPCYQRPHGPHREINATAAHRLAPTLCLFGVMLPRPGPIGPEPNA